VNDRSMWKHFTNEELLKRLDSLCNEKVKYEKRLNELLTEMEKRGLVGRPSKSTIPDTELDDEGK